MKEKFSVFLTFFTKLEARIKRMFYMGIILSLIGGTLEAYLFGILDGYLNQRYVSISIFVIIFLIFTRFAVVFILSHFISKSSSEVVRELIRKWLMFDNKAIEESHSNISVSVLSEAERIGMGYFLAWQNLFTNLIQLLLLLFAASILATSEFWYFVFSITPIYLIFLNFTINSVSSNGAKRMKSYRKLSSQIKLIFNKPTIDDYSQLEKTIDNIRLYIYKVRVMSLIQKPTLESLGVVSIAISMAITYFLNEKNISDMLVTYGVLVGILLRAFPFMNQVQNAVTLISSVHVEVVNSLKNEKI